MPTPPDAARTARRPSPGAPAAAPAGTPPRRANRLAAALLAAAALSAPDLLGPGASRARAAEALPVFDAHIHYSHDAWDVVPVADVIALMRKAGLKHALVSSSDDDGTRRLHDAAPDLVVPSLRPYRRRAELSTWFRDETVIAHLERRLERYRYAAIGEFHLYGADADLPVPRRVVQLAREHGLVLHAHSDADAIERIFRQDPRATVLWAHSGFERPETIRALLRRYPALRADLAFRSDHASGTKVDPEWRALFTEFPQRFVLGTDTFTPERLHYIPVHADGARTWLADLPRDLAERIAWRNAQDLIGPVWEAQRRKPRVPAGAALRVPAAGFAATSAPAAAPAPPDACERAAGEPGAHRLDAPRALLVYRTEPPVIRVGRPFRVVASVCAKASGTAFDDVRVDAQMPLHRHGMNYAPILSREGGRIVATGLNFHMPGRWQFVFDLRGAGATERLTHDVEVR